MRALIYAIGLVLVDSFVSAALPIVTFTRDITFHRNGETVKVVHVPAAPTDGDSIVHLQDADVVYAASQQVGVG